MPQTKLTNIFDSCYIDHCDIIKQEAQLMLTNPRDAFGGQSRSPNIVPFYSLGIVTSCAIVLYP